MFTLHKRHWCQICVKWIAQWFIYIYMYLYCSLKSSLSIGNTAHFGSLLNIAMATVSKFNIEPFDIESSNMNCFFVSNLHINCLIILRWKAKA